LVVQLPFSSNQNLQRAQPTPQDPVKLPHGILAPRHDLLLLGLFQLGKDRSNAGWRKQGKMMVGWWF
jgi:hypothetical protein